MCACLCSLYCGLSINLNRHTFSRMLYSGQRGSTDLSLWRGLGVVGGKKPYGLKLTYVKWMLFWWCAVYSGELGAVHQVLCETGGRISVPDCNAVGQLHHLHAFLAACHPQVWQEDSVLRGHVDPATAPPPPPLCGLVSHSGLPDQLPGRNGCLLCLPPPMASFISTCGMHLILGLGGSDVGPASLVHSQALYY